MIFILNQTLICKKTIIVGEHGIIKDEKYTIGAVQHKKYQNDIDYIMVNGFLGYYFYTSDKYECKKEYIWNNFYHPNEIRKMKLEKILEK